MIATAFVRQASSYPLVVDSGMDGPAYLCDYDRHHTVRELDTTTHAAYTIKHGKYVKNLAWSPLAPILASADGTDALHKVLDYACNEDDEHSGGTIRMEALEQLHLNGTVEAMCFLENGNTLCCYSRGTSYLSYFHLDDQCKLVKHSLNGLGSTSGFDDHVYFAVMLLSSSPNHAGKYLAAATENSRNIILRSHSSHHVRNLYDA